MARKKTTKGGSAQGKAKDVSRTTASLGRSYTLDVFLLDGPLTNKFVKKNRRVSRTIAIRGDQTLEDLHLAIFDAFDRNDEHLYEFQFGTKPRDPEARRYVLPGCMEPLWPNEPTPAGRVDQTTIDSLGLKVGDRFAYWFDFGDDWWHQVNVEAVEEQTPEGEYPRVTKRVGESPPQYVWDEEDE